MRQNSLSSRSLRQCAIAWLTLPLLTPSHGPAQEPPGVTPADLEIYAAAVDSTAFPDKPSYVLLEDGYYRVEEDGTLVQQIRVVRQILLEAAVNSAAELSFGYDPGREEFTLDWARVVDADGNVISAQPVHVQELDEPVARNAPVYSDRKRVRASLGDLAAGQIVDLRYTLRRFEPTLPGDFLVRWTVNGTGPVRRSRLVLDAPAGMDLSITERNLPVPGAIRAEGGRSIHEWDYDDVAFWESEPFASDTSNVPQEILVSGSIEWDDIASWYTGLAEARYDVTPELEAKLAEIVEGAASLTDSLRALHRWVSQDIRYASISLGIGGYQPRPAGEVLTTGVGDCKDKTTLFLSLARRMGVQGHPVLVRTSGVVWPGLPSVRQFNHMVAAITVGGERHYLDLTVPFSPFGEVYGGLQGRRGVLLGDDGTAEVLTFPTTEASANRSSITVEGSISEDGEFRGTYTEVVTGSVQYRIRSEFRRNLTERQRESIKRGVANRVFDDARTDSLELFDGLDLNRVPRLWASIRADGVVRNLGELRIVSLKIPRYGNPELIARLEEDRERRFPIDAGKVFGRREHYTEYRLLLPEGWTADLPPDVRAESVFGLYESTYRQEGRELVLTRLLRGTDGVFPPEREAELLEWFRVMYADDVEDIVFRVAGRPGAR